MNITQKTIDKRGRITRKEQTTTEIESADGSATIYLADPLMIDISVPLYGTFLQRLKECFMKKTFKGLFNYQKEYAVVTSIQYPKVTKE